MRPKAEPEVFKAGEEQFWDLCGPLLAQDGTEEGTLMSSRCLRTNGDFVAMVAPSGRLVVKLAADRVQELIDHGLGEAFAPAKKVFKEWVALTTRDDAVWQSVLEESHAWVSG